VLSILGLSVWFMWTKLAAGVEDVVRSGIRFSAWRIAVAWACVTACTGLGALAWVLLVRGLGGKLGTAKGMQIHLVSNLAKYVPGFVWSYAGKAYLATEQGVSAGVAVLSVLVEFAILYVSGAAFAVLCLPFSGLVDWPIAFSLAFQATGALLAVGAIAALPRLGRRAGRALARARPEWERAARLNWPQLAWALAIFGFAWVLLALGFGVLDTDAAGVLGLPGWAELSRRAFALVAALLVGQIVLFIPMGLGVRESVFVALLSPALPVAFVLVAALVFRLAMMIGEAVWALGMTVWPKIAPNPQNNTNG
jgi:uncharacterized membrane protein YbhN (UPF0104 family)